MHSGWSSKLKAYEKQLGTVKVFKLSKSTSSDSLPLTRPHLQNSYTDRRLSTEMSETMRMCVCGGGGVLFKSLQHPFLLTLFSVFAMAIASVHSSVTVVEKEWKCAPMCNPQGLGTRSSEKSMEELPTAWQQAHATERGSPRERTLP